MMNGHLIPDTPIAVDFWKIRQCGSATVFFLSHIHSDHMVGLTSSWSRPIYCSEVTGELLCEKIGLSQDLIRPLELHNPTLIPLDPCHTKMLTVTAIDANHCPGSVMFLFQGYFGTILYTGDFRYMPQMFVDSPLDGVSVDVLYLDNTYCDPSCLFGSREEAKETIFEIIESYPEHDVLLGMHSLGKPELLISIAKKFSEYIAVPPLMYKYLEILQVPNVFQVDTPEHECRLRVMPHYSISAKLFSRLTRPTIAVVTTAIYVGLEGTPYANQSPVHVVPYSDHSSYVELQEFVKRIQPGRIIPIVGREAKGPFNISFAKRADMSVFDQFLSESPQEPFTIPVSVNSRKSSSIGASDVSVAAAKRSRRNFARTVSRAATVKGVIFESSPQKKDTINVQKNSAQCPDDSSAVKKADLRNVENISRPNPKVDTPVINSNSNPKVDTPVINSNSNPKVDTPVINSNSNPKVDTPVINSNSNPKVDTPVINSNSNPKVDTPVINSNSNPKVDTPVINSNSNPKVDTQMITSNSTQVNRSSSNPALSMEPNRPHLNINLVNNQTSNLGKDAQVNIPNLIPDTGTNTQSISSNPNPSSTVEIDAINNEITDGNTHILAPPQELESQADKPHPIEGTSDHQQFVIGVQELEADNNSEKRSSSTTSSMNSVVFDVQPKFQVVKLTDDALPSTPQTRKKKRKLPLMFEKKFYSSHCKQRRSDIPNIDIRQTEAPLKSNVCLDGQRENIETDAREIENNSGTGYEDMIVQNLNTRSQSESSLTSPPLTCQSETSLVFTCSISKYFGRFEVPTWTYESCQAIFSDFVKKQRVRYRSKIPHPTSTAEA